MLQPWGIRRSHANLSHMSILWLRFPDPCYGTSQCTTLRMPKKKARTSTAWNFALLSLPFSTPESHVHPVAVVGKKLLWLVDDSKHVYIYIYLYYIFVYARKSSDMMHKIECVKCVTLHKIPHVGKIYMFVYTHSTCVSCVVYILSTYFIQVKFVILADQDS